ncbi:MAG: amidohydrolase family protein [Steroidobacteraceae bacterium]|jgi:imidazolonepropionase-like amidohydrolase|nr:amidohydrolase family protein [Steroidobacteraceae bacterium]
MRISSKLLAAGGLVAALAAFFLALPEPGDRQGAATGGAFAIRGARVFDGEQVLPKATVLVRDGRIEAVGRNLEIPAGVAIIEAAGRTLLPGLIDSHVHAWGSALVDALNFGVTTTLGMFGDPAMLRELKPHRESLAPVAFADHFSSGWLATVPGGHGTQFGLPVPTLTTPAEAAPWVEARLAEGSDYIKIVYEPKGAGGLGPPFPSLDAPTMQALIEATKARSRPAVVHISRLEPARTALEAGADGLVHVFADRPIDEAFLALAVGRGAFVTPTLAVTASIAGEGEGAALALDPRVAPFLSPDQQRTLTQVVQHRLAFLNPAVGLDATRRLAAAGVDILAGSDAPNPGTAQGVSLHHELAMLVRAGLTPVEALVAATSAPARRFGLQERGRIAPGMRADLLLVAGDPTTDIGATLDIERIWKNGAPVERRRYTPTTP